MKRFLVLIKYLIFAGVIFAQQPVDYLVKATSFLEYGKTIALLSEGLRKNQDYRLFLERAEAFIAGEDYRSATADYLSANTLQLSSGEYGLARLFALKGDPANSLIHLENNINSNFKRSEKAIMLDAAFSQIENTPEWRLFWKKERYSILEKKISEVEYYVSIGKSQEAANLLNDIPADYMNESIAQYARAMVDLSQVKYAECISILTRLLETDKNNEPYLRLLAKAQTSSGNPAGSSQSYSDLIDMGVPDAGLYMLRAACFSKTGETDKALSDVLKFLEYYPDSKNALSFAGKLEAESGDNLKAIDFFSRNLKLHPNDPDCFIDRANSYLVSGTWDYAIGDYSMALDIQPANSDTWLNKGIALLNVGKTEDACHDFRNSLDLGNKKATLYISRHCIK
jgi:tetratricopeptide (TPR) repeat protein